MCQAYEAESRMYSALGDSVTQSGFEDYLSKRPRDRRRGLFAKDYDHGWACAEKGILPWCVEKALNLHRYDSVFHCPACGEDVKKYSESTHRFGFPCDGSNPLEHQRKQWRHAEYVKLKAEFEPNERDAR